VITFKFRETPELRKTGNPEPNPVFSKQRFRKEKKDRCRDSMEAVLINGVDCITRGIFSSKLQRINVSIEYYIK
jgi:hypothetical protein